MIIKWSASTTWGDAPAKKEYARETEHFYIKANNQRDSKISRYERYFDSESEAVQFIGERNATRSRNKEIDQIRQHAVELLSALEAVVAVADRDTDEFNMARAVIAKAKGLTQ